VVVTRPPAAGSLRRALVEGLCRSEAIRSAAVRRAFLRVPRERFVPDFARSEGLEAVYTDQAIVTKKDSRGVPVSSSSQPAIMAPMLERLDVRPGQRVLEIGTGSGYNAALLSELVGRSGEVVSVDIDPDVANRARSALRDAGHTVKVEVCDGRRLAPIRGRFDRVIVTASTDHLPRAWHRRLVAGGLLVTPFRLRTDSFTPQVAVTFRRAGSGFESIDIIPAGFMALRHGSLVDAPAFPGEHGLSANAQAAGKRRVLCSVQGPAVGKLSSARRSEVLAQILRGPSRSVRIGGSGDYLGVLMLFVFGAASKAVELSLGSRWGMALLDVRVRSLAALTGKSSPPACGSVSVRNLRLETFGARDTEMQHTRLIDDWERFGRPAGRDAVIRVRYDGGINGSRPWRAQDRHGTRLEIDWQSPR
jgi:protein-L-isoaspartate(D-aspartate) O-methyltransferase